MRQYIFQFQIFSLNVSRMTSIEHSEFKRNVYNSCDPQYLRELRKAAGMDPVVLARIACLSVAQVRQLESDDNDHLFYSEAIKRQAYKRLLMILGAEPPTVEFPQDLRDADKVAQAHANTLAQIVAMSEQPALEQSTSQRVRASLEKFKAHRQAWGALSLLAVAIVLFAFHGPKGAVELVSEATSSMPNQPASAPLFAEPPSVAMASVPALPPVVSPVPAAVVVAPAPVASASPVVASANAVDKVGACAYATEPMPELTSSSAHKEGRYVYLVSTDTAQVCVVDGNQQATLVQLKANENRSVYGVSPWQVSGSNLQKVQIYFQGGRVPLPDAATARFKLVEVSVAR